MRNSIIAHGQLRSANKLNWNAPSEVQLDKMANSDPSLNHTVKHYHLYLYIKIYKQINQVLEIAKDLKDEFFEIDMLIHDNIITVQKAFSKYKIGPHHFSGSTGYGHGDIGRTALDKVNY